ncbi:MAG: methyl-accepting chemotaxis protein [Actinobacteria bacterium]|nr:methyl-accepting chemotaxis protein [Actinomycetota bacterium]
MVDVKEIEKIQIFEIFGKKINHKGLLLIMEIAGMFFGLIFPLFIYPLATFKSLLHFLVFFIFCVISGMLLSFLCYRFALKFGTQLLSNATSFAEEALAKNFISDYETEKNIEMVSLKFANLVRFSEKLIEQIKGAGLELRQVLIDIQKIGNTNAAATAQLASSITEISATMEEIARTSSHIAKSLEVLAINSQKTLKASEEGRRDIELTNKSFTEAKEANDTLTARLSEILSRISSINDIVNFIEEISAKTKILALNASIEAARAGEKGKGFSVVASEIRGLTERISSYTSNIKLATQEIFEFAEDLEFLIEENHKRFDKVFEVSKATIDRLAIIESAAKETDMSIKNIRNSVEHEKMATNQIASSMREVERSAQNLVRLTSSLMEISNRIENEMERLFKSLN